MAGRWRSTRQATVWRANVVIGAKSAQALFFRAFDALIDQFANHADESRMRSDGCGADHIEPQFVAQRGSLCVKVKENFQVIGNEPDRRDHDIGDSLVCV